MPGAPHLLHNVFGATHVDCSDWRDLVSNLEQFPLPRIGVTAEGEASSQGWVFRGVRSAAYGLEPAIERHALNSPWSALESLAESEFRSRAHLHLAPSALPKDRLNWLALMQHYGVPTRLLAFSYSPFVALYFAIRRGSGVADKTVRIWAVDAQAVNDRFRQVAALARHEEESKSCRDAGLPVPERTVDFGDADQWQTTRDGMLQKIEGLDATIRGALDATERRRNVQEKHGCVCVAVPSAFRALGSRVSRVHSS